MTPAVIVFVVLTAAFIYWGQRGQRVSEKRRELDQVDQRLAGGPGNRDRMY
ncbi:MAG: hypothetical protein WBV37_01040 [Nocardioidaceae bacterium]